MSMCRSVATWLAPPTLVAVIACGSGAGSDAPAVELPSDTPLAGSPAVGVAPCGSRFSFVRFVIDKHAEPYLFDEDADRFVRLPHEAQACSGPDRSAYRWTKAGVERLLDGVWVAAPTPEGMKPWKDWGDRDDGATLIAEADGMVIAQSAGNVDLEETQRVWRVTKSGIEDWGRPWLARFTGGCSTASGRVVLVGNKEEFRSEEDGFNFLTEELLTYENGAWQPPVQLAIGSGFPRLACVGESAVLVADPSEPGSGAGMTEWEGLGAEVVTGAVATPVSSQEQADRRRDYALVVLDHDRLMRLGGVDSAEQTRAETWILTVSTRTWSPGPPLASPRKGGAALARRDGSVLVLGGTDARGKGLGPELLHP